MSHGNHHGHSHGPHDHGSHSHAIPQSDTAIIWAIAVNLILTVAQVAGGFWANSTALIADGVHNLSDAGALILAFGARHLARRPATPAYSFGWGRAEIIAAFVNYISLILISLWLVVEALTRLNNPPEVAGGLVMGLAALALVIDLVTAALVFRVAQESSNMRAAFLHNLADAGVSVAVIIGGGLIWAFGWHMADPIITIGISAVIIWHVMQEIGPVWRNMMLAAPLHLDHDAIRAEILALPGVTDLHHLHLWQIDERRASAQMHLVLHDLADGPELLVQTKLILARHGIDHSTIQLKSDTHGCADKADDKH